jgi:chorismate lyase/3-hydroxybenzoate synthase
LSCTVDAITLPAAEVMHVASAPIPAACTIPEAPSLTAPTWIARISGLAELKLSVVLAGLRCGVVRNSEFCRVTVKIERAVDLDSTALRERTEFAYQTLFQRLQNFYPVRFWNFLPAIHQLFEDGQNRYMVFNSGRYQAFEKQYGNQEQFDSRVATASAVGHLSDDLWIHCLASRSRAVHLANPRQISPHRYSARYGKRPPCFARATYLTDQKLLLIGGTASICGEDSLHEDLTAQTNETVANLIHLITSASQRCGVSCSPNPLGCIVNLRVYHPRLGDALVLGKTLRDRFPAMTRLSLMHADLCRAELLVEIEGVAQLLPNDA